MAITYKEQQWSDVVAMFPVLHRVNYNAKHEDHWHSMHEWCKDKCQAAFYWAPQWAGHFIEFEDDEDAVLFALVWS